MDANGSKTYKDYTGSTDALEDFRCWKEDCLTPKHKTFVQKCYFGIE